MLDRLKRHLHHFRHAEPGERFERLYREEERDRKSPAVRVLLIAVALVVIAGGVVLMPLPGPGILIVAVGAGFLAMQSLAVARLLDRLEPKLRAAWTWLKRRFSGRRTGRAPAGGRAPGSAPARPRS
jgi:hypothetical protein